MVQLEATSQIIENQIKNIHFIIKPSVKALFNVSLEPNELEYRVTEKKWTVVSHAA